MDYSIRDAVAEDMDDVLGLIKELASYENELDEVEVTSTELIADGFGAEKRFHCFVAEAEKEVVGIALVFERYSTWKGRVVHLEDLIVTEKMRGSGLGTALLKAVVSYADERQAKRVSWEVLDWNEPAIKFYESKGAKVMRDWDVVQLDAKGIKNFLDQ
ncbi:MAG: GNAT family N-acetyltransferase [Flavobacteriaceae bacterium]|nr:GNAT family N-acetyltransferase [Flavobacteriaceae bacterium]